VFDVVVGAQRLEPWRPRPEGRRQELGTALPRRHRPPLRKLTIGRHGSPWTPETARREAKTLLGMIEDGADPAADKMARREAPTIAELAKRFLAEHAEAQRKGSTAAEYKRLLDKIILPALAKRKVGNVTRADVTKLHHANRKAPYQANRVLAVLSKMFNLAERWGLRPDGSNPCRHVEKFAERKRERMLSPAELARLGDALAAHSGSPYAVAAVKVLVFTGTRLGEVLGLRWEWIDFEHGEARLPDSKTGAKTLHLPPPALAVLAELPRLDGNPYVIAGAKPGAAMVNLEKPWRAIRDRATVGMWHDCDDEKISSLVAELTCTLDREPTIAECREAAAAHNLALPTGLTEVRLHDLRHAFASVAASSGMGLPIIGKMLGHSQPATTARHAHLASDPVKAAATSVASKIAAAMGGSDGKTGEDAARS
jgi:integrase